MDNNQSTFNWQKYLADNPDVAASTYASSPEDVWRHYSNYGIKEGRKASFDENAIQTSNENNQANFNWVDYLKNNPDVAASSFGTDPSRAWEHYSKYGINEGRQATFDLGSKNTLPSEDNLITDPKTGLEYSTTPGHVGYIAKIPDVYGGFTKQWMPSAFDFTGAKYNDSTKTFTMPSGEKIGYDFASNNISTYDPVYDKAGTVAYGSDWQVYAPTSGQRTANFQGLNLGTNVVNQGEFLVDPNTHQFYKDSSGNPIPVQHKASSGGLGDFLVENGWMLPLAMAGVGAGAALGAGAAAGESALGAGAAEGIGGAGGTGLTGGAGGSTGLLTGGTTAGLTIPTGAAIAIDPAIAAGAGALGAGGTAATGAGLGAFGELGATLPSAGSVGGAGAGMSAELAPGAVLGNGLNGGAIGGSYLAGANGMVATDLLGNAIPASSVGMGGIDSTAGLSASDVLTNANRARSIAKLLLGSQGASKVNFGKNIPTAQQYSQFASFNQPVQEQFGGYYQMNKNPFTFQNPLANALKGSTSGLDVSGTGGQALNTQGQASNLAKLLA